MVSRSVVLVSGRDVRQFERLAQQYSLTFEEVMKVAAELIFAGFDPAPGEGERIELVRPNVVGPDYFVKRNVPTPDADVDILSAWDRAQRDAEIGRYLLDTYPSREMALAVHANLLAWFRFWAVRFPIPDQRQRYAELATLREGEMQRVLSTKPAPRQLRVVKGGA